MSLTEEGRETHVVWGGKEEIGTRHSVTAFPSSPLRRDPNLWTVKCKVRSGGTQCGGRRSHVSPTLKHYFRPQIGEERATAIALMRKFIAYQFTDTVRLRGSQAVASGGVTVPWCPQHVPSVFPRPPAPADQVSGGPRARQGLHLRGGLQADACQAGDRGCGQPAHGLLEPADGPHQGDDRCPQSGEGGHQPQAQILGAPQKRDLQG